jgi:hypothetical protein
MARPLLTEAMLFWLPKLNKVLIILKDILLVKFLWLCRLCKGPLYILISVYLKCLIRYYSIIECIVCRD